MVMNLQTFWINFAKLIYDDIFVHAHLNDGSNKAINASPWIICNNNSDSSRYK